MKGAVATDKLPEGDTKRLKLASADDYKKSLGRTRYRNGLHTAATAHSAARTARTPPAPPKYDESELAFFSGATSSGNEWQAWINVRSTGETLHLASGDPVKIGALDGKIESVEERSLVFKTGDKRFRVALGESLRKGKEIDAKMRRRKAAASQKLTATSEPRG